MLRAFERLEQERLEESFVQKLREQEKLDQEKREQKKGEQEQETRELDRRKGERQRRERREQEKAIESEGSLAAESTRPRSRRRQARLYSPSFISTNPLLQDPTPLAQTQDSVWITFKVRERGVWKAAQSLHIYSSNPSEVERIVVKYMRKKEQIMVCGM